MKVQGHPQLHSQTEVTLECLRSVWRQTDSGMERSPASLEFTTLCFPKGFLHDPFNHPPKQARCLIWSETGLSSNLVEACALVPALHSFPPWHIHYLQITLTSWCNWGKTGCHAYGNKEKSTQPILSAYLWKCGNSICNSMSRYSACVKARTGINTLKFQHETADNPL